MKNYNNYGVVDVRDSSTTVGMTVGVVDDWIPVSTGMTTGEVVVGGRDSSTGVGMTGGVEVVVVDVVDVSPPFEGGVGGGCVTCDELPPPPL